MSTAVPQPPPSSQNVSVWQHHRTVPPVVYTPVTGDPVEAKTFERILSLLKHDWVWDFFFNPPINLMDQVSYAINDNSTFAIEFEMRTMDTPDVVANNFKLDEVSNLILLPSFSTGHVSVGFAITEQIKGSCLTSSQNPFIGRTVRNDLDGSFIYIAEDHTTGLVEVMFFSLYSPAYRERVFLNCHYDDFRSAMTSLRNSIYDHHTFHSSLVIYSYCRDSRTCPICNNPPTSVPCSCKISIQRKTHPRDDVADAVNQELYLGSYSGICTLALYDSPKNLSFVSRYMATVRTTLLPDVSVRDRLTQWALFYVAQQNSLKVSRSLQVERLVNMATANGMSSPMNSFIANALFSRMKLASFADIPPVQGGMANMVNNAANNADGLAPRIEMASSNTGFQSLMLKTAATMNDVAVVGTKRGIDVVRAGESGDSCWASLMTLGSDAPSTTPSTSCDANDGMGGNNNRDTIWISDSAENVDMDENCDVGDVPLDMDLLEPSNISLINETNDISSVTFDGGPQGAQALPTDTAMVSQLNNGVGGSEGDEAMAQTTARSEAVVIAPAGTTDKAASIALGVEEERRRKAELRKVRNRLAAHKSNEKRKLELAQLQEEINVASRREAELRAKEKLLRQENVRLRIRSEASLK